MKQFVLVAFVIALFGCKNEQKSIMTTSAIQAAAVKEAVERERKVGETKIEVKKAVPEETLLMCKGKHSSPFFASSIETQTFAITKENGKVVKVINKSGTEFTEVRTDRRTAGGKSAMYTQLILKPGAVVLHTEVPESTAPKAVFDTIIKDTGTYEHDTPIGFERGECTVTKKVF